jgi:hypothetical protein
MNHPAMAGYISKNGGGIQVINSNTPGPMVRG